MSTVKGAVRPLRKPPAEFAASSVSATFLDAMPICALVVDSSVRVLWLNRTAQAELDAPPHPGDNAACGEVLRCQQAQAPSPGCGRSPRCGFCALRKSVVRVVRENAPWRGKTSLAMVTEAGVQEKTIHATITPLEREVEGDRLALVMIEDMHDAPKPEAVQALPAMPAMQATLPTPVGRPTPSATTGFPLADSLSKVRRLVGAIRDADDVQEAGHALGLTARIASEYALAAEVLQLLSRGENGATLMPRGRALLATTPGSAAEADVFRAAIEGWPVVALVAPTLMARPSPTKESLVEALLSRAAHLAPKAAERRAEVLLSWRRYVMGREGPRRGVSEDTLRTPPKSRWARAREP